MTRKIILECVVGSTLHGTHVDDGLEDLDLMGVFLEEPFRMVGFHQEDTWVWRTKPDGVRSEAGDTDFAGYGLRKFLGLALKCNPTVLLPFFVPNEFIRQITPEGEALRALAPLIVSKQAYSPFMGYMRQQHERLIGARGQRNVTRPELIERYGYDTKYAGHIIRLGFQGAELLRTGRLSLPMVEREREFVIAIRTGKYTLPQVSNFIAAAENELKLALRMSTLQERPQIKEVEKWMIQTYFEHWNLRA
jgi:hypothetical protein